MLNNVPPFYFPLSQGRYEVKPGLHRFPHDFGNGLADQHVFQLDNTLYDYRHIKLGARLEKLEKYYQLENCTPDTRKTTNQFIVSKLISEHPDIFHLNNNSHYSLHCLHTGDILYFDAEYRLLDVDYGTPVSPIYQDLFDALACQIQEDLSIVQLDEAGRDSVSAIHLCFPNHWAAKDKIGKGFVDLHAPVPGMEKMNRGHKQIVHAMLYKGPYVRFAWGVATDKRLNHHPVPPDGIPRAKWLGRHFNKHKPELYLRVERQTLHGFSAEKSVLFTIRSYLVDIKDLQHNKGQIDALLNALSTMQIDSQHYKGVYEERLEIIKWLQSVGLSSKSGRKF